MGDSPKKVDSKSKGIETAIVVGSKIVWRFDIYWFNAIYSFLLTINEMFSFLIFISMWLMGLIMNWGRLLEFESLISLLGNGELSAVVGYALTVYCCSVAVG